ncbi:aldose epimerase family protein [Anaerobranca gottschalkii]|uniref:Aldose 1-epimerase n=1 Tax=Anaerobranca gottschalkii DSM 13577 TaxID=1120990 RepID=A0A1H9ZM72_9FIRM|nr:aldose epimerase family protein [Anaerobranca gottschalkii]SES82448.1 aldose 1-epimerase [Anaerobranca gottschalkii DSM 13577]
MKIDKSFYGEVEGRKVFQYSLKNSTGTELIVLNYGAIINKLLLRDRKGELANVVLTLPDLESYQKNPHYLGCVIGRYAGRIRKGQIVIDNQNYQLSQNEGENTLHGGFLGFGRVIWEAETRVLGDYGEIHLTYRSPHGEEGFQGNLNLTVIYRLNERDNLEITYRGISDRNTCLSPTNHSYFNLSGKVQSVEEDYLKIYSNQVLKSREDLTAEKDLVTIEELNIQGPYIKIKEYMDLLEKISNFRGIDHTFYVGDKGGELVKIADYYHQPSGRLLEVYTNHPYINIYSGNFLNPSVTLEGGSRAVAYGGICFETCEQPNAPHWGLGILPQGVLYQKKCLYKFSVKGNVKSSMKK